MRFSLHASTKDTSLQPMVESEIDPLVNDVPVKKRKHIIDSFSLATMYSFLLLVCCVWLVVATVNTNVCESKRMIVYVNNVMEVFIFVGKLVLMSQMFTIRARWMDTGQRRQYPHLLSE
jgi:hypothetical protein